MRTVFFEKIPLNSVRRKGRCSDYYLFSKVFNVTFDFREIVVNGPDNLGQNPENMKILTIRIGRNCLGNLSDFFPFS